LHTQEVVKLADLIERELQAISLGEGTFNQGQTQIKIPLHRNIQSVPQMLSWPFFYIAKPKGIKNF